LSSDNITAVRRVFEMRLEVGGARGLTHGEILPRTLRGAPR
jgi:hypothetical protein